MAKVFVTWQAVCAMRCSVPEPLQEPQVCFPAPRQELQVTLPAPLQLQLTVPPWHATQVVSPDWHAVQFSQTVSYVGMDCWVAEL